MESMATRTICLHGTGVLNYWSAMRQINVLRTFCSAVYWLTSMLFCTEWLMDRFRQTEKHQLIGAGGLVVKPSVLLWFPLVAISAVMALVCENSIAQSLHHYPSDIYVCSISIAEESLVQNNHTLLTLYQDWMLGKLMQQQQL